MRHLLLDLCAKNGTSGWEDEIRARIEEHLDTLGVEHHTDALGNLFAFKKGRKPAPFKLALMAHMDEVGLLVKSVTEDGFLKIVFSGIDPRVLPGQRMFVGLNKIPGVIGLKAVHQTTADERTKAVDRDSLYIDIGAADKAEAEGLVSLADPVHFDPEALDMGQAVRVKALDDRVGCAVMLKLLAGELAYDTHFVFTAQEESGMKGAKGAAYALAPDRVLIIEGTTAADRPDLPPQKQVCRMGGGVVIPFMDGGTMYDRGMFAHLRALCERKGIPWQTKEYISGGTDAAAVQRSRAGVRVAGIAIPARHIHTPASMAAWSDVENLYALAQAFLDEPEGVQHP